MKTAPLRTLMIAFTLSFAAQSARAGEEISYRYRPRLERRDLKIAGGTLLATGALELLAGTGLMVVGGLADSGLDDGVSHYTAQGRDFGVAGHTTLMVSGISIGSGIGLLVTSVVPRLEGATALRVERAGIGLTVIGAGLTIASIVLDVLAWSAALATNGGYACGNCSSDRAAVLGVSSMATGVVGTFSTGVGIPLWVAGATSRGPAARAHLGVGRVAITF